MRLLIYSSTKRKLLLVCDHVILLGSDLQVDRTTPEVVFNFGGKMVHSKKSGEAKGSKSACIVNFSLTEEIGGIPVHISPSSNAYGMLQKLNSLRNNTNKKLDSILKAHAFAFKIILSEQNQSGNAATTNHNVHIHNNP